MIAKCIPNVIFKTRIRDASIDGENPFRSEDKTTADYFGGKKVVLFSLPRTFTPTCSTYRLSGFKNLFELFRSDGV